MLRLLAPTCLLGLVFACGGSQEPPTPAEAPAAPEPAPAEVPAEPAPEETPEGFPDHAGEALKALAVGGRLARCKAPESLADGAYKADGGAFVAVEDGWVVLTANQESGTAGLWVGAEPTVTIRWQKAERDRWGTCQPARFHTFEVSGKVLDDGGQGIEGAVVGGCLRGRVATTDAEGVFSLMALPDQGCRLYAATDDGTTLRAGGPVPVRSQGEDALVEIVADATHEGARREAWFRRLPRGSAVRARAMVGSLDLRRRAIEGLDGEIAALATGWIDQVAQAWEASEQAVDEVEGLNIQAALGRIGG